MYCSQFGGCRVYKTEPLLRAHFPVNKKVLEDKVASSVTEATGRCSSPCKDNILITSEKERSPEKRFQGFHLICSILNRFTQKETIPTSLPNYTAVLASFLGVCLCNDNEGERKDKYEDEITIRRGFNRKEGKEKKKCAIISRFYFQRKGK